MLILFIRYIATLCNSQERRIDRVRSYNVARPRHYRPFEPEPTVPISEEGCKTEQSHGTPLSPRRAI